MNIENEIQKNEDFSLHLNCKISLFLRIFLWFHQKSVNIIVKYNYLNFILINIICMQIKIPII